MSNLGITSNEWQNMNTRFVASKTHGTKATNLNYTQSPQTTAYEYDNYLASNSTDGEDDGKIGFFEAAKCTVKGAAKGLVNGVKGMFTDSEGNFSLGKTLLSVGVAAACIAFPAVGLVACGIGAVVGGAKVIGGVSNVVKAQTEYKSDAMAKEAWEQVGDGALTVGLSVAGAKASYGAVVKSAGTDSAINAMKASGEWQNATNIQKVSALGKDMVLSTKNNYATAKAGLSETKDAIEVVNLRNKVSKFDYSDLAQDELALIDKLENAEAALSEGAKFKAAKIESATDLKEVKDAVEIVRLRQKVSKLDYNDLSADEVALVNKLENAEAALSDGAKLKATNLEKVSVKNLNAKFKETNTGNYLNENTTSLNEGGIRNIFNNIKANKNALKLSEFTKNLSKDGKAVIEYLQSPEATFYGAVNKYGYSSVLEAIEAIVGMGIASQNV